MITGVIKARAAERRTQLQRVTGWFVGSPPCLAGSGAVNGASPPFGGRRGSRPAPAPQAVSNAAAERRAGGPGTQPTPSATSGDFPPAPSLPVPPARTGPGCVGCHRRQRIIGSALVGAGRASWPRRRPLHSAGAGRASPLTARPLKSTGERAKGLAHLSACNRAEIRRPQTPELLQARAQCPPPRQTRLLRQLWPITTGSGRPGESLLGGQRLERSPTPGDFLLFPLLLFLLPAKPGSDPGQGHPAAVRGAETDPRPRSPAALRGAAAAFAPPWGHSPFQPALRPLGCSSASGGYLLKPAYLPVKLFIYFFKHE